MTKHITTTGFTFTSYQVEYEIELSEEQAALLRGPNHRLAYSLAAYLGHALRSLDLKIADNGNWALYIVISSAIDIHEIREEIGDYIAAALVIAEGKGLE